MLTSLLAHGIKPLLSLSSRWGGERKLWVLIFHRVLDKPDPLRPGEADRSTFDKQMSLLVNLFNVLPLDEAINRMELGTLPLRAVSITFDDGYADNLHIALPILKKYRLPATVFVATGFLDGGIMWNDSIIESVRHWPEPVIDLSELGLGIMKCETEQEKVHTISNILGTIKHLDPHIRQEFVDRFQRNVAKLPDNLMLTSEGVQELYANGIEIGGHTVTHPILASLSDKDAEEEIAGGKEQLEKLIGNPVRYFAYPNGRYQSDYTDKHVDIVTKLEFKAALTTHWGVGTASSAKMQLPRFTPWDRGDISFLLRAAQIYQKAM